MTEKHKTGPIHAIEAVHSFINDTSKSKPLQNTLFLRFENCIRKKQSPIHVYTFLMFTNLGLFKNVEVDFHLVGHTHEGIDKAFRETSSSLQGRNTIKLLNFLQNSTQNLCQCCQSRAQDRNCRLVWNVPMQQDIDSCVAIFGTLIVLVQ